MYRFFTPLALHCAPEDEMDIILLLIYVALVGVTAWLIAAITPPRGRA